MCKVLKVCRSSYYKYLNKGESSRNTENKELASEIFAIYKESKCRYGAPKIHKILLNLKYKISLKRVQKLMKKLGIKSIVLKKYRPYSSKNKVEERENLLNRDFSATNVNQKWVTDITYINTLRNGWCYLSSVMDLCTRKIIGYSFSKTMDTDMAIKAIENALKAQRPTTSVTLHSDLGTQYTSNKFKLFTEENGIIHSFSRKGNPYDNACIESFHAVLKKEEVNLVNYFDYDTARLAIFEYIESWYNRKRIHSSLGYITPQQKEDKIKKSA